MYVFVVLATHISENTVMTEVRGVFAHVWETTAYAEALRGEGYLVRVQKHSVHSTPEPARFKLGKPEPAFPERGVPTVPSSRV